MTDAELFLSHRPEALEQLRRVTTLLLDALEGWASGSGPRSAADATELARLVGGLHPCPEEGLGIDVVLAEVSERVLAHGIRTFHPGALAHLHSPTLLGAAACELAIGATNQSLDSFDQAPAATVVEDHLVRWLAGVLGLPAGATGVLTAGGTASNLLGLLLARDHAAGGGWSVAADGLPPDAGAWRIVASAAAHFSVQKAAAVLGLGRHAVVTVPVDRAGRMDTAELDTTLQRLDAAGARTVAVVGTAGTTDHGAIDPLAALAERAAARDAWFHVDAAVGSALALSERLRPVLDGLERADSITADLHKLWWQPIGASALLVRDPERLAVVRQPSDYLDRPDDEPEGVLNLVSRSLDTSRRFDALKILVSLRSVGRRRMAAMVEHLVDLAAQAATLVDAHADLELVAPPSTITVLLRRRGGDAANAAVQRRLFAAGRAVIGRTRVDGRVTLKLTLVNPQLGRTDIEDVLTQIAAEYPAGPPAGVAS